MNTWIKESTKRHFFLFLLSFILFITIYGLASATSFSGEAVSYLNGKKVLCSGKKVTIKWDYSSGKSNKLTVYSSNGLLLSSSLNSGSETIYLSDFDCGILRSEMYVVYKNGTYNKYVDEIEVLPIWEIDPSYEYIDYKINGVEETIVFSGRGPMTDWYEFLKPWDNDFYRIRHVIIHEGITSVGNHSFSRISRIETVSLPSTLVSIGSGAFSHCYELKNLIIPENVTSIGAEAFLYSGLEQLVLPGSLQAIGDNAFDHISNLSDVYYFGSKAQWKKITCDKTKNPNLYSANLHFITDYGKFGTDLMWMLDSKGLLTIFGNSNMSIMRLPESLTTIEEEAFANLNMQAVIVPSSCTSIGKYAFKDCKQLRYIISFSENVVIDPDAFEGCNNVVVERMSK